MDGLGKLIQQQHEYEAYKTEKAEQLAKHVDHLKYTITTELLEVCEDFDHSIKDPDTLIFSYKDLTISIQIINPITEQRPQEKEYNLAKRAQERLKIVLKVKRKKGAINDKYEIFDKTQYKKHGPYIYQLQAEGNARKFENFLEVLDMLFDHTHGLKVEFPEVIDSFF